MLMEIAWRGVSRVAGELCHCSRVVAAGSLESPGAWEKWVGCCTSPLQVPGALLKAVWPLWPKHTSQACAECGGCSGSCGSCSHCIRATLWCVRCQPCGTPQGHPSLSLPSAFPLFLLTYIWETQEHGVRERIHRLFQTVLLFKDLA